MQDEDRVPGYIRSKAATPVHRIPLDRNRSHMLQNPQRCSGRLLGTITVLTPLHVGIGDLALPDTLDPQPSLIPDGVPLVAPFFREDHQLVVPGTSLKGAFRHLYEAVTHSCYAQYNRFENQGGRDVDSTFKNCTYRADNRSHDNRNKLCPACRVFGALGYLGQIAFQPAYLSGPYQSEIIHVPQRWKPEVREEHRHTRKIYTHQPMLEDPVEPVEVLPPGTQLTLDAHFRNLSDIELGLLLLILGQDSNEPLYPKLGGLKAHGCGAIEITLHELSCIPLESYHNYDVEYVALTDSECADLIKKARKDQDFYSTGWNKVVEALGKRPEVY